jgi:K+-transporting ATPase KdpF subunit
MNGTEITALVIAVGLLGYLTLALLKPEWFS